MSLNYSCHAVYKSTVTNVAKMRSFEVICNAFNTYNHVSNKDFIKQNRTRIVIPIDMPNWRAVELKADFDFCKELLVQHCIVYLRKQYNFTLFDFVSYIDAFSAT